jgi:hypothetical protein
LACEPAAPYSDNKENNTMRISTPCMLSAVLAVVSLFYGQVRAETLTVQLDPELCFNLPRDYSLTFSGQYRFGRDLSGGSAAINLRKQW